MRKLVKFETDLVQMLRETKAWMRANDALWSGRLLDEWVGKEIGHNKILEQGDVTIALDVDIFTQCDYEDYNDPALVRDGKLVVLTMMGIIQHHLHMSTERVRVVCFSQASSIGSLLGVVGSHLHVFVSPTALQREYRFLDVCGMLNDEVTSALLDESSHGDGVSG